jgi:hypothetical protein
MSSKSLRNGQNKEQYRTINDHSNSMGQFVKDKRRSLKGNQSGMPSLYNKNETASVDMINIQKTVTGGIKIKEFID